MIEQQLIQLMPQRTGVINFLEYEIHYKSRTGDKVGFIFRNNIEPIGEFKNFTELLDRLDNLNMIPMLRIWLEKELLVKS